MYTLYTVPHFHGYVYTCFTYTQFHEYMVPLIHGSAVAYRDTVIRRIMYA